MMFLVRVALLDFVFASASTSDCRQADAFCIATVGPVSYCKPESGTCHGDPSVRCDCGATSSLRPAVTAAPRAAAAAATISIRQEGTFMWLEWPGFDTPAQWREFYSTVLRSISDRCSSFPVTRLIIRVNDPEFQANRGQLWQVSTESALYRYLLSELSLDVEVYIYPYLTYKKNEENTVRWRTSMGTSTFLEGVYKYVSQWNRLLQTARPGMKISGIVTDLEEHDGFLADIPSIPAYRARYSTPGETPLKFGAAVGFDQPGKAQSISSEIDHVYLEMYDYYVYGSEPAELVNGGEHPYTNNPEAFLNALDDNVWTRFMRNYGDEKLHFMWSLQSATSQDCLFPLNTNLCGQKDKDDFGTWTPEKVSEFFDLAEARHPVLANRPKGFFQFSFMPHSWLRC